MFLCLAGWLMSFGGGAGLTFIAVVGKPWPQFGRRLYSLSSSTRHLFLPAVSCAGLDLVFVSRYAFSGGLLPEVHHYTSQSIEQVSIDFTIISTLKGLVL